MSRLSPVNIIVLRSDELAGVVLDDILGEPDMIQMLSARSNRSVFFYITQILETPSSPEHAVKSADKFKLFKKIVLKRTVP